MASISVPGRGGFFNNAESKGAQRETNHFICNMGGDISLLELHGGPDRQRLWRAGAAGTATAAIPGSVRPLCDDNGPLCTEINEFPSGQTTNYEGQYVGHDEPSLLFYSNVPGSGNHMRYRLVLPRDPPVLPNQAGTGGTFNFQLHPAFWFGIAMCDTQSYPNPGNGVALQFPIPMPTSPTAATRPKPTSSASMRERRSWRCSSIRPAGCSGRPATAATRLAGVPR